MSKCATCAAHCGRRTPTPTCSAFRIGGSAPSNCTSTTAPITATTRPVAPRVADAVAGPLPGIVAAACGVGAIGGIAAAVAAGAVDSSRTAGRVSERQTRRDGDRTCWPVVRDVPRCEHTADAAAIGAAALASIAATGAAAVGRAPTATTVRAATSAGASVARRRMAPTATLRDYAEILSSLLRSSHNGRACRVWCVIHGPEGVSGATFGSRRGERRGPQHRWSACAADDRSRVCACVCVCCALCMRARPS